MPFRGDARVGGALLYRFEDEVRIMLRDARATKHRTQLLSIPRVALGDEPQRAAHEQAVEALLYEVLCDREVCVVGRVAQDLREARSVEIAEAVAHLEMNARDSVESRIVFGTSDGGGVAVYHVDTIRP